ncbi:MAG: PAS domain S-box protein, partial [Spirochaetia bacterium]|nr:PAS domain S-box protein [Spirochaetia bacterium]
MMNPSEAALSLNQARLQAILDTAVDSIIIINSKGQIQDFNPAAETLFQYKKNEIIGKNISLIMPEPFKSQHDDYISRYIETGRKNIIGIGREVNAINKTGELIPVHLSVSEMNLEGEIFFVGMLKDISQLKQTENNLKQKQTELNLALQAANAGTFFYDISNDTTTWDSQCYEIFGFSKKIKINNQRWENCIYHEDFEDLDIKFSEVLKDKTRHSFAFDYRISVIEENQSTIKHIETKGEIIRNPSGEATHILGLNFDTTDQVKIKEDLKKSEARLKRSQRIAKLGNWELDLRTGKMWCSEEIYNFFGKKKLQSPIEYDQFIQSIHPEDLEKLDLADRLYSSAENYDEIYRIIRPDKTIRFIHEIGEIQSDNNGLPYMISGTMQDISDFVKIEEELRLEKNRAERYLDLSESIIVELGTEGTIQRINNRGAEILGYSIDELINKNWFDTAIPEEDRETIRQIHKKLLSEEGKDFEHFENIIKSRTGKVFHIL